MKNLSPETKVFKDYKKALSAFKRSSSPCDFLEAKPLKSFFLDFTKRRVKDWPNHFSLISTK